MNAQVDYRKFLIAPSFPTFEVSSEHGATVQDNKASFSIEYGSHYICLDIAVREVRDSDYSDYAVDNDPQNNIGVAHWVFEITNDLLCEVTDVSDSFIQTQAGQFIQLTEAQIYQLKDCLDALNADRFEQMIDQEYVF